MVALSQLTGYHASDFPMANISWGTPAGEYVPTVIDTGSYGFWVAGPNATVNSGSPYLGVLGPCNQTMEPFFDYPASTSHTGPYLNSTGGFAYGGGGKLISSEAVHQRRHLSPRDAVCQDGSRLQRPRR